MKKHLIALLLSLSCVAALTAVGCGIHSADNSTESSSDSGSSDIVYTGESTVTLQGGEGFTYATQTQSGSAIKNGEYLNFKVELGGICILSRAVSNSILRISPADAMNDVIKQSNLQSYNDNKLLALDLIQKLLDIVPTYRLLCKPDMEAVDVCFNEIVK